MAHPLHISFLVEERYLAQPQPAGLCAALRARGHQVTLIVPETAACELGNEDWLEDLDLIIARGRSWMALALLAQAEARGKLTVNSHTSIAAVHNKAEMAGVLRAANMPTPRTFLGKVDQLAGQVPAADYPLILKPIFGDNGQGLRIVHDPAELARLQWPEPIALAQPYLPNDGYDLKLYGIGDEIQAVCKPSALNRIGARLARSAQALALTPAMQDLGRRCRHLFGLELYGVDCVQTPEGPVVIEVNDFPNYSGLPDADERLADYIEWRARRA